LIIPGGDMNSLDIVILLIMTVALAVSAFRGGIREIFSFGAVIAGFLLAANFYHMATEQFIRPTSHEEVNYIISFLSIFIFSTVLISFIGGRISHAVKKSKLKPWDAMLGTAIGALKGLVISCLIVYALLVFLPTKSRVFTESRTFPYLSRIVEVISPIAPTFFQDEFTKKMDEFKKSGTAIEKTFEKKVIEKAAPVTKSK